MTHKHFMGHGQFSILLSMVLLNSSTREHSADFFPGGAPWVQDPCWFAEPTEHLESELLAGVWDRSRLPLRRWLLRGLCLLEREFKTERFNLGNVPRGT